MPKHVVLLLTVMNCILLTAFVGGCIDFNTVVVYFMVSNLYISKVIKCKEFNIENGVL